MGISKDAHTNTDKATWRYIKMEAISSQPVARGHAEQNGAAVQGCTAASFPLLLF